MTTTAPTRPEAPCALLDLAVGSLDFGSGFWDNEQTEVARKCAVVVGLDPATVTPANFIATYEPDRVVLITDDERQQLITEWQAEQIRNGEKATWPTDAEFMNLLRRKLGKPDLITWNVK